MGKRKDPAWRDHAAAELMIGSISRGLPADAIRRVLLAGAVLADTPQQLRTRGLEVVTWNRRKGPAGTGTPWPRPDAFDAAIVRLPKGVDELVMTAHAVRSALAPASLILLYGAKDEGIGSAPNRVEEVWGPCVKVAVGGHCRVLRFAPEVSPPGPGSVLADWREAHTSPLTEPGCEWISYPGVFGHRPSARGQLDPGTQALVDTLPTPPPGLRILDYGCGSGPLAAAVRRLQPESRIELADVDAVALEAARANVPGAEAHLLERVPPGPWGWIVSNPPFHQGKAHTDEILERLIRDAAVELDASGRLIFVTQRRLLAEPLLKERFRKVVVLGDQGPFRVWSAQRPIRSR